MSRYTWVRKSGTDSGTLSKVGIDADGSLWNPNGYPEDEVRRAVEEANQRRKEVRSEAAKKAAVTRKLRVEKKTYEFAQRLKDTGHLTPSKHCLICRKRCSDPESVARGVGSDCWQNVLAFLSTMKAVTS